MYFDSKNLHSVSHITNGQLAAWDFKEKKNQEMLGRFFFPFKDNIFLRKGVAAYKNDKKLSEQSWSIAK